MDKIIKQFLSQVSAKNQNEAEFMQAVTEVAETVIPYIVTKGYILRPKYSFKNGRARKSSFF